jgi:hypothetical protein
VTKVKAEERVGAIALALFALRTCRSALAICDSERVLYRNRAWFKLEHDRTPWRATARDPLAPTTAPTLMHLATDAAQGLLARAARPYALSRYERPARGDVFDVRMERMTAAGRRVVGVCVTNVTRLVAAERRTTSAAADHRLTVRPSTAPP